MDDVRMMSVEQASTELPALIREAHEGADPVFIAGPNQATVVLLDAAQYAALVERLEDLEDCLDVLQARLNDEPSR